MWTSEPMEASQRERETTAYKLWEILENNPEARENDNMLYFLFLVKHHGLGKRVISGSLISVGEMFRSKETPKLTTIIKARKNVTNWFPHLRTRKKRDNNTIYSKN